MSPTLSKHSNRRTMYMLSYWNSKSLFERFIHYQVGETCIYHSSHVEVRGQLPLSKQFSSSTVVLQTDFRMSGLHKTLYPLSHLASLFFWGGGTKKAQGGLELSILALVSNCQDHKNAPLLPTTITFDGCTSILYLAMEGLSRLLKLMSFCKQTPHQTSVRTEITGFMAENWKWLLIILNYKSVQLKKKSIYIDLPQPHNWAFGGKNQQGLQSNCSAW